MYSHTLFIALKKSFAIVLLLTVVAVFITACKQQATEEQDTSAPHKYSMYIMAKDDRQYIIETDSLNSGIIYPEKAGAQLNLKDIDRALIVKNDFYYHINEKTGHFSKYRLNGHTLQKTDSVLLKGFSIENYYWLGKDTLLLIGLNVPQFTQTKYAVVNVANMAILSSGTMQIPGPAGRFNSMSIGFVEHRGNELMLGYTYHQLLGNDYTTSDTTYVSWLSYPAMKAVKTVKDVRSTYPGGINLVQSYGFDDEQHDYYFMTCPGIALGNRPDRPTGIYRIKNGSHELDKDYFFNISASKINNHAYGIWYLGNGQAIIRNERKDLYKDLSDHYSTPHFEFQLLDIKAQTVKKLPLPLDKGTRRECVLVENGIAYITINSPTQGNYVWLYNIKTGSLTKGMQLVGETDWILRLDRLN